MTMLSTSDLLRRIPLFSALTSEQIDRISHDVVKQRFKKDAVLVSQGATSEALHVFLNGRAHVLRRNGKGREVIISVLQSGDYVGEMSLVDDEPNSATVRIEIESDVLILSREIFMTFMPAPASAANQILLTLVRRLRYANEQIESLALMDVNGRVARMLLELAETDDQGELMVRSGPSLQDLAKMIGSSREMVSRAFRMLAERGFLQVDSNNFWRLRIDIRSLT